MVTMSTSPTVMMSLVTKLCRRLLMNEFIWVHPMFFKINKSIKYSRFTVLHNGVWKKPWYDKPYNTWLVGSMISGGGWVRQTGKAKRF